MVDSGALQSQQKMASRCSGLVMSCHSLHLVHWTSLGRPLPALPSSLPLPFAFPLSPFAFSTFPFPLLIRPLEQARTPAVTPHRQQPHPRSSLGHAPVSRYSRQPSPCTVALFLLFPFPALFLLFLFLSSFCFFPSQQLLLSLCLCFARGDVRTVSASHPRETHVRHGLSLSLVPGRSGCSAACCCICLS